MKSHPTLDRRQFLGLATAGAAGVALQPSTLTAATPPAFRKRIKLGIATYSYWHFRTARVPIETVIDKAAELGVEGVDILHRQMDIRGDGTHSQPRVVCIFRSSSDTPFAMAFDLICLSIHQDFVDPDPESANNRSSTLTNASKSLMNSAFPAFV
jgi:L-ribulose-5-phosphate 3-epimerase